MLGCHILWVTISVVCIAIFQACLELKVSAALHKCSFVCGGAWLLSYVIVLRRRLILNGFVCVKLVVLLWKMFK